MIRNVLSVLAGYLIFVVSSLALFKFSGVKPHAEDSIWFMFFTGGYGAFFSMVSGFVTSFISKKSSLNVNYFLALIIAGFAAFSMFKSNGSHWTQIMAIFIFAPSSILGGFFQQKRK